MKEIPINKGIIKERLSIIEAGLSRLKEFKPISLKEFKKGDNFGIAEHHLRRSLEAMLDIGTHILSRIPGVRPNGYKGICRFLGQHKIVPENFANQKLTQMAGYRNRLIHLYHEITKEELYNIIQNNLSDLEDFCKYIVNYITNDT